MLLNIRIENSQTVKLNVHNHIAELQLIPRPIYERRVYGEYGSSRGHMNYVLWRDLQGQ